MEAKPFRGRDREIRRAHRAEGECAIAAHDRALQLGGGK